MKHVQYAQLVGAYQVLGRLSPLFLKGGWEAMDPIDAGMGSEEINVRSKEVGEWMEDLQRARQIAMQSQQSSVAKDAIKYNLKAKDLDLDVGDKVWVMFPNVGIGKTKKLAFKLHGTYMEWLHDNKRVALLSHEDDEKDIIKAHVDRMVKDLEEKVMKMWKPIKLNLVYEGTEEKEQEKEKEVEKVVKGKKTKKVMEKKEEKVDEEKIIEENLEKLDEETRKDIEKELDDEEYAIEKIIDHQEDEEGVVQYKVRFVGYGPKDDLWYDEDDLVRTSPMLVSAYQEKVEEQAKMLRKTNKKRSGRKKV